MPKRGEFPGLNKVRRTRADGSIVIHYYLRSTGKKIEGRFGSKEFRENYQRARLRDTASPDSFSGLIALYRAAPDFTSLADATQRQYRRYLDMIESRFGGMPVSALEDRRVRGDFMAWRDEMLAKPKTADYVMQVLSRVISFGFDRGLVSVNWAHKIQKVYSSDRSEIIWQPDDVARFMAVASIPLCRAMALALFTGQRQQDLLALTWPQYDGEVISIRQKKTGSRVVVPVHPQLKSIIGGIPKDNAVMLTTITGRPWTAANFKKEWRKATLAAGIEELHFHDLRGTAITLLADRGCTVPEIASITGHSFANVNTILSKYLARNRALAVAAMKRLENGEGTVLQTAADRFANVAVENNKSDAQSIVIADIIGTSGKR